MPEPQNILRTKNSRIYHGGTESTEFHGGYFPAFEVFLVPLWAFFKILFMGCIPFKV